MLGWLDRVFHWGVTNIGGTIIRWVRDLIHVVWGMLRSIFGNVALAWHDIFAAANWIWTTSQKFGAAVLGRFFYILHVVLPFIVRWAGRELQWLSTFIVMVWKWGIRETQRIWSALWHAIADVIKWTVVHIYDPLFRSLALAWHWIQHEGTILWFMITHPDKLVDILWDALIAKLEADAWNVGAKVGGFLFALIMHNL